MDNEDTDIIDKALGKMLPPQVNTDEKIKELLS